MEVIKQWIDESDVYLLILGGRYGSIESKTGKSYTQLEYEYAFDKGKPLFACVLKETALDARIKKHGREMIDKYPKELDVFRELVQTKMVEFWEDPKDIQLAIIKTLNQLSRREDLLGWVRPHPEANLPALSNEIARLSKENAELRNQLGAEVFINGLSYPQMKTVLQRKGVWDFLKTNREQLRNRLENCSEAKILAEFGLMQWQSGFFMLTDSGTFLLNRVEFEELPPLAAGLPT